MIRTITILLAIAASSAAGAQAVTVKTFTVPQTIYATPFLPPPIGRFVPVPLTPRKNLVGDFPDYRMTILRTRKD